LLQIHPAVHQLRSSQDFDGRRCVTLTYGLMTLNVTRSSRRSSKHLCKFWFKSLQRFGIYRVHKTFVAAWPWPM